MEKKNQKKQLVTADQEIWIKERLKTLINMAFALKNAKRVGADDPLYHLGIEGIIEGAAWEIIRKVGLEPSYENLKHPYNPISNNSPISNIPNNQTSVLEKK